MRRDYLRQLTSAEVKQLLGRGCSAESWDDIFVSDDFAVDQLFGARFGGSVEIESGVVVINSFVSNYTLCEGAHIESVTRLECSEESSFGVGCRVNTINENGGRSIMLHLDLTSQEAYLWAMNRHRGDFVASREQVVAQLSELVRSSMGRVGAGSRIVGARFVREVIFGEGVVVEGASLLECGTILDGGYVGVDVVARQFICVEDSRLDTGASVECCFVGERVILAEGFSAQHSLFFASSHLERGEAVSIFAGAYTVSHHRSSLLIAGLFSMFNAGSGSNQSNHLFKRGAIHQAIHPRGCKFASGAYVMSPAREGLFTMVKGSHAKHHDTYDLPYSYLIEDGGRSMLMPGANLISYGTQRDLEKWRARDCRTVGRDIINFEEYNPCVTGVMIRAVNLLHSLSEKSPEAEEYIHERVVIRASQLRRGVGLYNKAIAASLGAMLSVGELLVSDVDRALCAGDWADIGGAYLPMCVVEEALLGDLGVIYRFEQRYDDYAHTWAYGVLSQLLGRSATAEDVDSAIEASARSIAEIERQRESDGKRDLSPQMSVGYGCDWADESVKAQDFRATQGL